VRLETEKKLSAWVPAVAWTVLIFCVSSIPHLAVAVFRFEHFDKLAHATEYTGLGVFLTVAYWGSFSGRPRLRVVSLLAIATGLAIAVADEAYQLTVPGRATEFYDWMADAGGVTLGGAAMAFFYARFRPWVAGVIRRLEKGEST